MNATMGEASTALAEQFHSQFGQDMLLGTSVFKGGRGLTFVDIGAHDGVTLSNTLHFERDCAWTGLCIEANPAVFPDLKKSRRVPALNIAIADRDGSMPFYAISGYGQMLSGLVDESDTKRINFIKRTIAERGGSFEVIQVPTRTLAGVLAEYDLREVHYLSVDTEGNEPDILRAIDHSQTMIHVVGAEGHRRDEVARLAAALGPSFARAAIHFSDTFFINRSSPFFQQRIPLALASIRYRLRRRIDRSLRRLR